MYNGIKEVFVSIKDKMDDKLDSKINNMSPENRREVPNKLTILRIIISLGMCGTILTLGIGNPIFMTVLAGLTALTDVADGYIARRYHLESKKGAFLDALADKCFNYGLIGALLGSGIMPLTLPVAGLMLPVLARDLGVAMVTAVDKYKDGKLKKDIKVSNKEDKVTSKNLSTTITDKIDTFENGNNMPPTILGKLKMWTISLGVVGGLAFGFQPVGLGLTYYIGAIASNVLCAGDILLVAKNTFNNYKKRKECYKKLILEGHSDNKLDELKVNQLNDIISEEIIPSKKHTLAEEQLIEAELVRLTESNNESIIKAPYQKQ